MNKTILAAVISTSLLAGCGGDENAIDQEVDVSRPGGDMIEGDTGTDSDGHAGGSGSDSDIGDGLVEGMPDGDMGIPLPEFPIMPEPDYGDDIEDGADCSQGGCESGTPSRPDYDIGDDIVEGEMPDKPVKPEDPIIDDGNDGSVDGTPGTKPDGDSDFVDSIPDSDYDDDMNIVIPVHPIDPDLELPIEEEPNHPVDPSPSIPGTDGDEAIDGDQGGENGCEGEGCYYPSIPHPDDDVIEGMPDGDMNIPLPENPIQPEPDFGDDIIDGDQGGDNGCEGEGCYYPSKPHPDDSIVEGMPDGDMNIPLPENPIQPEPDFGDDIVDGDQGGDNGCEGEGCYYPSKPHPDDEVVEGMPDGDMNNPLPENPIQPEPDYGDDADSGGEEGTPSTPDEDTDLIEGEMPSDPVKPEDPIIDDGNDGSVDGTPGTKPDEDSDFVESIPDGSYDDDMNVWIPEHPIDPDPELPIEEEPNHPIDPSPSIPGTDGDEAIGDGGVEGTDPTTPDNDSDLIEGEMPDKPVTPEDPIIDDGGDGSVDGTPGTKPDGDSDFVESIPDGSYDDDMNLIIPEHPIEEKPELPIQPEPDFGDDLVDGGGVDGTPSTPDEDTDLIEGVMPDKPVKPEDPIIDDGGDGSVDGTPGTKPDEDSDFVESIPDGSYDDDMNIVLPQHPIEPPKPDDSEDMIDGDQGGPNGCSGPGCYYPGKPSPDEDESDLIEGEMPDKPVKPEDPIIDDGEDGSVDGKPGTKPDEDSDFVESIPDGSYDDDMNIWIPEHPIEPEPELPIQPEPDYGDKPIIDDGEDGSVDGKPGTKPDDDSDFVDGLEFDVNVSVRTLKLKPYTKVGKHTPLSSSVVETMGISYGGHVELPTVEYSFVNDDGVSFSRPECLEDRNPRINRITEVSDKYYVMSLSHPGSAKDCSWGEHDKTSDYIVHKDEGYALELPFSVDMYGKEYAHLKPHSAHNTTDRVILLAYPENGNEHQLAYIVRPELNIIKPTMRIDRPIEGASNWAIFRPESIQDPDKPLPSVFYFYYTVEPDTVDSRGKVRNGKLAKYYALEGSQQEPVLKLKWREAHDIGYPFLVEGNMYAPDETPNQGNGYHYYKLIEGKHGGSWTEKDNLFPETMPRLANVTDVITHGDTSYVVTEFCTMYDENGKLYSKTSIFDHHLTNKKKQNTILVKDDSVFCYGDALSVKDKGYVPAIASIDVVNGAVDAERFKFVKDINTNGSDVVNARLNRTHLVFDLDNVPHSMDMKEMQTVNQEQYYGEEGLISDIIYLE